MLERLNEIKKAAILMGMDYNTWSEKVINDKLRKHYQSLRKVKAQNLKYFTKVLKEAKKYNIADITVLDCDKWIGDYGRIATDLHVSNFIHLDYNIDTKVKYVYNILRKLKDNKEDKRFFWVKIATTNNSELYHLFYIPEDYKVINYGQDGTIIKMRNGQLFDIDNNYYFSKHNSTILRKIIKNGYDYWSPNTFNYDIMSDSEKKVYYGFEGWEE